MNDEQRPAPTWAGDVHDGVDAWTHGKTANNPLETAEPAQRARGQRKDRSRRDETPRRRSRTGWPERSPTPVDEQAKGPDADPESVARTILLDQLTGRARSRRELADKLADKLVPEQIATRLLDRFEEVGLIDDEAFARAWVSQRGAVGSSRSLARRALAQELRRKGISDEVARPVLDEVDPADEEEAARLLVRKKLRTLSRVDDVTATRRLVGMLARKGYPSGVSFAVVRDELSTCGRQSAGDPDAGMPDDTL